MECIDCGNARAPCEFGCKVSIVTPVTAPKQGSSCCMPRHCTAILYDGHTLGLVIADLEKACRGCRPRHPRRHGYRAHNYPDRFKVCITGQIRRVTTLTWDRGKELADHRRFTLATNIEVYFCDPQCPWQRRSNENTNGLLKQYFPSGTDLSVYSQTHLNKVARQLNERPRKTLEFETPAERFIAYVASTV